MRLDKEERVEFLLGPAEFGDLPGLTLRQIRRLQRSRVVFILRFILLVSSLLMGGLGRGNDSIQFPGDLFDDHLNDSSFVHAMAGDERSDTPGGNSSVSGISVRTEKEREVLLLE